MMNSKKGLSDVVTTVLIILLVLAAVVIIWTFLKPLIVGTGQDINFRNACMNIDVKPISCAATATSTNVTYQLVNNAGADASTAINQVLVVVTKTDGSSKTITATVPALLETNNVSLAAGGYTGGSATAAAVLKSGTDTYTCDPNPSKITCV